jgi:hypothetical protein
MFFGKYLLDQKIITASQLIEGMAYQFESQPSLIRLLSSSNYLSDEKIIDLIGKTILNHKSLVETLTDKKILQDEKIAELLGERSLKGLGLGQSLINLGYLKITDLDAALKKYISIDKLEENRKGEVNKISPIKELEASSQPEEFISQAALDSLRELGLSEESLPVTPNEPESIEISQAALDSLKELGISNGSCALEEKADQVVPKSLTGEFSLDQEIETVMVFHGLTGEYLSLYNQNLYNKILKGIKALINGYDKELFERLHQDVHLILGASNLAELTYSEKILDCYCKIIKKVIDKEINFYKFNFMEFGSFFKQAIEISWELREEIVKNSFEDGLVNNKVWNEEYVKNLEKGLLILNKKEAA